MSGFGKYERVGRCYNFWSDFRACMTKAVVPNQCTLYLEDYMECVYGHKEYKFWRKVQEKILEQRTLQERQNREFKHIEEEQRQKAAQAAQEEATSQ